MDIAPGVGKKGQRYCRVKFCNEPMRRECTVSLLLCIVLATTGCDAKSSMQIADIMNAAPFQRSSVVPVAVPWAEGQTYDQWVNQFGGYGEVKVVSALSGPALSLVTDVADSAAEAHAALVTSAASFGNMTATISTTTLAQLQTPAPDSWDVAWVLWHYTDNTHFYYVILKPGGWELGKEDPSYPGAQRFLVTGLTPVFPIGVSYTIQISQAAGAIRVAVNGAPLVQFTDSQSPYLQGSIGLYCEESSVIFASVVVNGQKLPFKFRVTASVAGGPQGYL